MTKLLDYVRPRSPAFAACIEFLALTGMRQNEAVTLGWDDVDMTAAYAMLARTKTNRPRTVPLSAGAITVLQAMPYGLYSKYVFCHDGMAHFRNFSGRFAAYARKAKTRFRCLDLRHKFAIDFLRAGGDIYRLSRILGHSSVKTTEMYLGYVNEEATQNRARQ